MQVLQLKAEQVEPFKAFMNENGWNLTHQDAGQNHFVGWGYVMKWQKDDSLILLNYADKQGCVTAHIEVKAPAEFFNQLSPFLHD